ncbi:LOW QUALITY PROTEIN: hypothetical protein V2J09_010236 [Rumex salicifolius]
MECFNSMKYKFGRRGSMSIKLDMSKAYDRVEWYFCRKVMLKLGFHERWVEKILECVPSQLSLRGSVIPTRGIRQGDPLSHYLFVICTEERRTVSRSEQPPPGNSWQPPPTGCVKINVDAGSINGVVSLGAVCRSPSGAILFVATKSLFGKFAIQLAEALVVRWGLQLGCRLGMINSLQNVSFSFVRRGGNTLAHLAARLDVSDSQKRPFLPHKPHLRRDGLYVIVSNPRGPHVTITLRRRRIIHRRDPRRIIPNKPLYLPVSHGPVVRPRQRPLERGQIPVVGGARQLVRPPVERKPENDLLGWNSGVDPSVDPVASADYAGGVVQSGSRSVQVSPHGLRRKRDGVVDGGVVNRRREEEPRFSGGFGLGVYGRPPLGEEGGEGGHVGGGGGELVVEVEAVEVERAGDGDGGVYECAAGGRGGGHGGEGGGVGAAASDGEKSGDGRVAALEGGGEGGEGRDVGGGDGDVEGVGIHPGEGAEQVGEERRVNGGNGNAALEPIHTFDGFDDDDVEEDDWLSKLGEKTLESKLLGWVIGRKLGFGWVS